MNKTKSKPKLKLPKVWVVIEAATRPFLTAAFNSREAAIMHSEARQPSTVHAYAPVQPPRRCVWSEGDFSWRTTCDKETSGQYGEYCHNCGGRIVRRMA